MAQDVREQEVTTWSLEMCSPDELRPAAQTSVEIKHVVVPVPSYLRYLWMTVGGPWSWYERLSWSERQWEALTEDENTSFSVAYIGGTPIGFVELHKDGSNIEIKYFGLLPQFIGKGYGGTLLTHAVQQAWDYGASRVWVHTCSNDGPAALANYKARGFKQFGQETKLEQVPAPY